MTSYEDVWYQSDDRLELYARDYPNADSSHTVLCLHGLTRNSADFEDLALLLADRFRVISVDQRGRGLSEWDSQSDNYQPVRYVQDMFTLIEKLNLKDIILLGTSLGGLMSMIMVAMKPNLFSAVIMNDIGPVVDQAGLDRIKSYVGKSAPVKTWDDAAKQVAATNGAAFPNYQQSDWKKIVSRMYEEKSDGTLVLRYDPAISKPMDNDQETAVPASLWPLFDAMTNTPLLLIRGELSDILSPACVEEMHKRHHSMQLTTVANTGHAPVLDEPEAIDAINRFLDSV
jgi:pimeloyl-ACP methyl ester carboxylesterase